MNYFDKLKQIFTEAFNDSDGLKEGGRVNQLSIDEILATEYINSGLSVKTTATVPADSTTVLVTDFTSETPTELWFCESLSIGATKKCVINVTNATGPYLGSSGLNQNYTIPEGGGTVVVKLDRQVSAGFRFLASDGDGLTVFTFFLEAKKMTNDLNYRSKKAILWIGDSITRGTNFTEAFARDAGNINTAGAASDHFTFQVRNHFQRRGESVRLINKAMGSIDGVRVNGWLNRGWLDVHQADIIFYQLGMNDAMIPLTSTDEVYENCLRNIVDLRDRRWPNKPIVFIGDSPTDNDARHARLVDLRAIKQAIAIEFSDRNVHYITLENIFPRKTLSNYYQTDGTHPNIASNLLMSEIINVWIDANDIRL
jgi:lysophospholipase L1-like esterase